MWALKNIFSKYETSDLACAGESNGTSVVCAFADN